MKGRWWGGAVAHYWCLAWERMRGFGWGFFWGDSFFGSTRSSSEHSDFLRVGIFGGLFLIGSVGFSGLGHLFSDAALL